ncbi:AGE family epimerase/isomerase [Hymenobacter tibetensis]|uniref:Cellobiose 2-epimerase n=1 Tax=Hymenobacter tibetensis TaxID=497967 RepID=A0ABY4CYK4_9BACT|nr:AGE family epimerase/isomerase [Hymenobacter tibetensis]UOG75351.1 AGE family epimerase/isomerase [Hymenobacter tibetensis]
MMQQAEAFQEELDRILTYWSTHMLDTAHGGFYGQITDENNVVAQAPKGSVLNARILWTFSAAYRRQPNPTHLALATRAFGYLEKHFLDAEHGGVFWSVDYLGQPLDTRKQIYALAFAVYGLSEYYAASGNERALQHAQALFRAIEQHSFDPEHGGYLEALARDWSPLADLRLSDKDANEKKTMNTHLHILEAYTNLYRVWPDPQLRAQTQELLEVFQAHIIDPTSHQLHLFLDEQWQPKSTLVSFGHDIEASWLLLEAAEVLGNEDLVTQFRRVAVDMATTATRGLDTDGGLNYEFDPAQEHGDRDKHWWVQAEAMVGLLNAYQVSGQRRFYEQFQAVWEFTRTHLLDYAHGEWLWGVTATHLPMTGEDKAGFWKCPYHNTRACLEVLARLPKVPVPARAN